MLRILDIEGRPANNWRARRPASTKPKQAVRPILEAVRKRGDAAAARVCTEVRWVRPQESWRCRGTELTGAAMLLSPAFRKAVDTAAKNIRDVCKVAAAAGEAKATDPRPESPGQIVRPLDCVAAYIPAGRYPLPSTVLMTVIPAQVAGVPTIMRRHRRRPCRRSSATASARRGADVFQIGGAQAIAAFAYGTKTVPRADRIVGPGNIYVAAAKKLLAGEVGIDFVAGPTEILIIAADGDPRWIAADMLAQAEHDTDASAILLTTSANAGASGRKRKSSDNWRLYPPRRPREWRSRELARHFWCDRWRRRWSFRTGLRRNILSLHEPSLTAVDPACGQRLFGCGSPEAAGDYASGPNHVLPTSRSGAAARGTFVGRLCEGDLSYSILSTRPALK
ncbi:MAG: histidinol dehydrogenase [Paludibaculum sp.]